MSYSEKERAQLQELIADPRRVAVMCDEHFYTGDYKLAPVKGCPNCWRAYFFKQLADTPPDRHKQFVEELEAVVRGLVHAEETGTAPRLFEHPEVVIEHIPDEEFEA